MSHKSIIRIFKILMNKMKKIKIEVGIINGKCSHSMKEGDFFIVDDYKVRIPEGMNVCLWALYSLLPILPLLHEKEQLSTSHWINDAESMQCPDGKVRFYFRSID